MKGHNYGEMGCNICQKIHIHPKGTTGKKFKWSGNRKPKIITKCLICENECINKKYCSFKCYTSTISLRMKLNNPMKRKEVSLKRSGERHPCKKPEVRKKIKDNHADVSGEKNPMFGRHDFGKKRSEETKRKLRISNINRIKEVGGPGIGKNEKKILDELENKLNKKIIRQYLCIGYSLDGYIPELNLAIEVDEKIKFNYKGELYPQHIKRQNRIEKELHCTFLRIKDE